MQNKGTGAAPIPEGRAAICPFIGYFPIKTQRRYALCVKRAPEGSPEIFSCDFSAAGFYPLPDAYTITQNFVTKADNFKFFSMG